MSDTTNLRSYAQLLKLVPIGGEEVHAAPPAAQDWRAEVWRRRRTKVGLFCLFVVLPGLLAMAYFGLIAADRFESEARFVLRMPGRAAANPLTALLQSTGMGGRATDDAYAVREYILSRDAIDTVGARVELPAAFARGGHDVFWRFPNFFTPDNKEGLFRHYQRMVSVNYDPTSGVSTLRVQAFTSADARRLASALLDTAESLVNRLNERARRDAISIADSEVERMERRIAVAQERLTAFRNRESLVDPSQATLIVLEGIAKLSLDAAQLNMQVNEMRRLSPQSPQLNALQARLGSMESQIALERRKLAGDGDSIASKITEYEKLVLEREFSERALMTALSAVELARLDSQRQHVYLERVAEPSVTDYPAYPYRILWCLVVVAVGYMGFRMANILVDNARKHAAP